MGGVVEAVLIMRIRFGECVGADKRGSSNGSDGSSSVKDKVGDRASWMRTLEQYCTSTTAGNLKTICLIIIMHPLSLPMPATASCRQTLIAHR